MMNIGRSFLLGAAALASLLPAQAMAATFVMRFSGAAFNNSAIATGSFDITDGALVAINAAPFSNADWSAVSNLTLTITGAASGNGTFTTANFGPAFQFFTVSPLDFTRELVGQAQPGGRTFGQLNQTGASGDFNLFARTEGAPAGNNYFTLEANGNRANNANQMALVSLSAVTAAVPEPATWVMMMMGFGAMGFTMRRQKASARIRFA